MMTTPLGVLIVDDDYYAREAMRALVARDPRTRVWDVTDTVDGAVGALATPGDRAPYPAVILLDVRLAEGERAGIEGIGALRDAASGPRILVTSVSSDDDTVLAALRAGADGYVWKNETTDGIVSAILRVVEGRFVLSRALGERLLGTAEELGLYATEVLPERREAIELTENVRKTLYLFCVMGLSAKEIADELQVSVNTVQSRIKGAYQTLGARNRAEAFQRLVDSGGQANATGVPAQ